MFSVLIDALTDVLADPSTRKLTKPEIREHIKRVFLDTPKKIPGRSYMKRGGNGNNSATLLASIGAPVRLITAIGDNAGWLKSDLMSLGIETDTVFELPFPTPTSTIIVDPEITKIIVAPNLKEKMNFKTVPITSNLFEEIKIAFITPMDFKYAEILDRIQALPVITAFTLETQKITTLDQLTECVRLANDLMFANLDDAALIAGISPDNPDYDNYLSDVDAKFTEYAHVRVYTWGRRGSFICSSKFPTIRIPIIEVTVKDRTGAGDTYAAGFLAEFFREVEGKNQYSSLAPEMLGELSMRCAKYATYAAALKISSGEAPGKDDLEQFIKQYQ